MGYLYSSHLGSNIGLTGSSPGERILGNTVDYFLLAPEVFGNEMASKGEMTEVPSLHITHCTLHGASQIS